MEGMTLFSGFGAADLGMTAAGIQMVAGIEYDPAIAEVARANGHAVDVIDIRLADPRRYMGIDVLHASPVCTRASVANSSAAVNDDGLKEAALDIECAEATARFIDALRPKIFTLENVFGYRKFKSWRRIADTLDRLGYWWTLDHVNSADMGVPQTRRRMIVRAIHGAMVPSLPAPEPWIGWYQAIEDLIPTLPASAFAPWQLARLPVELSTFMMAGSGNTNFEEAYPGHGIRLAGNPAHTVTTVTQDGGSLPRAFLVQGTNANGITVNHVDDPCAAVMATAHSKSAMPRAFLVNTRELHGNDGANYTTVTGDQPVYTVASTSAASRHVAFLVAGANATHDNCARMDDEPAWTIGDVNRVGNIPRAWLSQGRIVKLTPRCLARFQTFPDSYQLPDKAALACRGIGNAVPALLIEKIYRQLLTGL